MHCNAVHSGALWCTGLQCEDEHGTVGFLVQCRVQCSAVDPPRAYISGGSPARPDYLLLSSQPTTDNMKVRHQSVATSATAAYDGNTFCINMKCIYICAQKIISEQLPFSCIIYRSKNFIYHIILIDFNQETLIYI